MIKNLVQKLALTSLIILVIFSVGCKKAEEKEIVVHNEPDTIVEVETPKDPDEIMKEFYKMINGGEETSNVALFINNSIKNLDQTKADTMILDYESHLMKGLNLLLKEYEKANSNPELSQTFDLGVIDNISNVKDEQLKELLTETINNGYLLLKGGGYIYPEIDYGEILKHKKYITEEVTDYLEIMEVESKNRFTYGDVIEIPMEELLNRVRNTENYLVSNEGSKSSNKIYKLYEEYMDGVILGAGNPYVLANEGTSIIKGEILNEYKTFVSNNKNSRTVEFLQEYIDTLNNNENDMDAPEVIEFYDNRHSNIKDKFRDLGL